MGDPFRYHKHGLHDAPVDTARCAASVADNFRIFQCRNKRTRGEWCGTHDPEGARAKAVEARAEAKRKFRDEQYEKAERRRALVNGFEDALKEIRAHGDAWSQRKAKEALGEIVPPPT